MQVAVLEKAFAIIEAMERLGRAVPLRRIVEETGIPKATAYRILHSLVKQGYAMQSAPEGYYQLTAKLAQLGRVNRYEKLLERALPYMEELFDRFSETTNLGVLEGERVHYLHSLETPKPLRWIVRAGSSDPFHCTALGRAIAAYLPREQLELNILQLDFAPRTSNSPTDASKLRDILAGVRNNGWALDDEENDEGVICFAVPLLEQNSVMASISVSMPKGRVTKGLQEQIVAALLAIGQRWEKESDVEQSTRGNA